MIKMFTTQLNGLFNRISSKEEFALEDGARLLAQGAIGEGKIYVKAFAELEAVTLEATKGAEPLTGAFPVKDLHEITSADRVLLFSRLSTDKEAVEFAKKLNEKNIEFVAVSGVVDSEESLQDLATIYIDTKLTKGMLPDENGNRVVFPGSMAGLFVYFAIKMALDEMLQEYQD
ncbi:DUF2529 domain-containing protein [Bacillus sp. 2205SS5-2]|uniref:DUF2529 domain-containing protein n=1 Tax=Bacillus sp. 2205SS5-2 TaxID=3109031 RepID=UPI003004F96D